MEVLKHFAVTALGALLTVGLVFAEPLSVYAQSGPSFDCAKASTTVEQNLCKHSSLGRMDGVLGRLYASLKKRKLHEALFGDQLKWLKGRDACGADTACLRALYADRLSALAAAAGDKHRITGLFIPYDDKTSEFWLAREADGTLTGYLFLENDVNKHSCELPITNARPMSNRGDHADHWLWNDHSVALDSSAPREPCIVVFRKDGDSLHVDQLDCNVYCGTAQTFDGTYKKQ